MIDEVDKMGADCRGDPLSALLKVLDPKQNKSCSDHYLGVPRDLSNAIFIRMTNLVDPIIAALRDRLEIIDISGHTEEEKLHIAKRYLVPRHYQEHGIDEKRLLITDEAILKMINEYSRKANRARRRGVIPLSGIRSRRSRHHRSACRPTHS